MAYCGPRTITFYDPVSGLQVTPAFLTYNSGTGSLSVQSTSKTEVAIHKFNIKLTLTNYPTVVQDPYSTFTIKILAECVDTTFEPFLLVQSALTANIYTNTTEFAVTLPKDSASNVQTSQDGYSYCKADR